SPTKYSDSIQIDDGVFKYEEPTVKDKKRTENFRNYSKSSLTQKIPSKIMMKNSWIEECGHLQKFFNIKSPNNLGGLADSFDRSCKLCNNKINILSFCLYLEKPLENSEIKSFIEIICHLQWNRYYRVFGIWECPNCEKPGKVLILLFHS
ncbi:1071_t:CDS:2, partial [Gigaspora margarita]